MIKYYTTLFVMIISYFVMICQCTFPTRASIARILDKTSHLRILLSDTDNPWTFLWVTSLDTVMEDIFRTFAADENTKIFNYNYVADVRNLTYIIKLTGIKPNVV